MSHLSPAELEALGCVAHEILEAWSARGHHVGLALEVDSDFRETKLPQSSLSRSIVGNAFRLGAQRASVPYRPGRGGSKEIFIGNGRVEHVFRLLKASVEDGEYVIPVKDDAILRDLEITLEGHQERWIFGYTLVGDNLGDIFVAPVLGVTEGNPGRLVLGSCTVLSALDSIPTSAGFESGDEDLSWGDEESDEGRDASSDE